MPPGVADTVDAQKPCLVVLQMVLDNGLRVFLLEDHEVPLVKGTLLMKGGARASPPNKVLAAVLLIPGCYPSYIQ